jgi:hypothetical protein
VLVERIDRDLDTAGDDLRFEDLRGDWCAAWSHPATGEDELNLGGPADVEVIGDQCLEESPSVSGLGEHDGARDLDLPHGDLPPVASGPVRFGQRQRQNGQPALGEHRDRARTQPVADRL